MISIELAIVCLAALKPKIAWPVLVALFVFFDFVLVSQLHAGAQSCGCFGATIKVSPYLMIGVDSALLALLLASRPWATLAPASAGYAVLGLGFVASAIVPWLVLPSSSASSSIPATTAVGSQVASERPRYIEMKPEKWVGQNVFDIQELVRWVPADKLPLDGKLVLWRQGCSHCAAHLRAMAAADDGSQPIVLLQVRDDLESSREVDAMPSGPHVNTLATTENLTIIMTTPWEIHVEGGVVTAALDEAHAKLSAEQEAGG